MTAARRISGRHPAGHGIALTLADGRIAAIAADEAAPDLWLAPGLIDLQVNGYGGLDLNDGRLTPETVAALCDALLRLGVTGFAPTLITAAEPDLLAALAAIATACERSARCRAMIPFIHVEGPFIAPQDGPRGAHPRAHVRDPDAAEVARWQTAAGGRVGLVTLAPERPGALGLIAALAAQGIRVALGHHAADPETVRAAAAAGATLVTHLGNGVAAQLPRHPNMLWSQLADDRLTAGFIADRFHLEPDVFKAMLRAKGLERAFLVSDTVALAGQPAGRYTTAVGGVVEVAATGRIGVADTPYLAGAGLPLGANVAIACAMAELPLAAGIRLATDRPGAIIGDGRGRLEVGAPADLIAFHWRPGDDRLDIADVWLAGERVAP